MSLATPTRTLRLVAVVAALIAVVAPAASAQVCSGAPYTFDAGATFTPPAGDDYTLTVSARGADGARPTSYPSNGGRGAVVVSRFVVPGGTPFKVFTGTAGTAGEVSGGGGGGTALVTGSTLLTVAGGGGGGGQAAAHGQGGRATLAGPSAGGAAGTGTGGGGGGGGFGAAGAGTAGSGGGAGTASAQGLGGTGGGSVVPTAPGAGGNGGNGIGGGGGGINGGGGGGGYIGGAGGFANLTSYGGGLGGTSYVNTGVFSGEVVSATAGASGDVYGETPGDPNGKKNGQLTVTCEVIVPPDPGATFPGTDGLGNDTGWRLVAPIASSANRGDFAGALDLSLTAPGGVSRLLRWTGRTWVAAESGDALGGGRALAVYLPDSADEPLTSAGITVEYGSAAPTASVSVSSGDDQTAFSLFGNPFAQPFDLSTLGADGFRDAVFVWDYDAETYRSRSRALGDELEPGQAAFVRRDRLDRGAGSFTLPAPGSGAASRTVAAADLGRVRLAVVALDANATVLGRAEVAVVLSPDASTGPDQIDSPAPGALAAAYAVAALGDAALGQEGLPLGSAVTRLRVGAARLGADAFEIRLAEADGGVPVGSIVASWGGQSVDLSSGGVLTVPASGVTEGTDDASALDGAADVSLTLSSGVATADEAGPDASALALSAAPNPVRDRVRLAWTASGTARLAVYDALGREVAAVDTAGGSAEVDVRGLPAGVYVARLTTSDGVAVRRLTVVR